MSDDDLSAEVQRLRTEVDTLRRRVADLEATIERGDETTATKSNESLERDIDETDQSAETETDADGTNPSEGTVADDATGSGEHSSVLERDWERTLGIKWLGLVGGLALVVGVVLFIQLAIEAGLLGHLGRVAVGTAGGLALLGSGRFVAERQGYVRWGRIAAGAGLAIAYFSIYAAYGFESYREAIGTPLWATLAGLTVLVAATALVSVHDRAPLVASAAFSFGYVTAFLSLEAGTSLLTPAYVLFLSAGLVAIATIRPWHRAVVASVGPTYVLLFAWWIIDEPTPSLLAAVTAVAFGLYLAGGYVRRSSDRDISSDAVEHSSRWSRLWLGSLTVCNAGLAATLLEGALRDWLADLPVEGVAVGAVALALVGVYATTARRPVRRDEAAGSFAVVLLGVAAVLAFGTFWATVGLVAIVCGGVAVATLRNADAIQTGSHFVAVGITTKLLVVDASELPAVNLAAPLASATGRAAAFALAIGVFYGLALWFRREGRTVPAIDRAIPVAGPYAVAATGLAVVLLGLELSGAGISVAWAVFGLALVGAGLTADVRGLRLQGVAVLALVTAKVFLFDTQDLDALARTTAFLVLGAILLVAAYGYARWQGEDPIASITGE
ncbi:DUF2339 domain-containing protein [Salinadaptatus halalkaliphilus]|uniref:DUF2339 domain-containing protein n=1 Tax=Salinadaptatus halalkaliphilus TaxID=2419781 RepID=A0A4V3VLF8_9EURY|nr:DUF2339 domain-containing protein [Salinadaptatus halalkaliphilus]THE65287.1 DUF2339 domain-containing protein [Salinadaptatus halalkaliphilus]